MEAAAFTVEGASAAEVACAPVPEAACAPAEAAGFAADRLRHPLRVIEALVPHRAPRASSHRGLATTSLDPVEISRAGISGLEIQPRLPLLPPTAVGIPLEGQAAAVDLRAHKCKPGPPVTPEASTSLTGIADRDLVRQFAAFRVRAAKFGRILPQRGMLFPVHNRFPLFTIPSTARGPQVPDSGRTRRFPRLHVLPADRHSWAIVDFRVV